jgi:hypothetical protein
LIAAVLLHAGIPLAARVAPRPEPVLLARASGLYSEVEVEVRPVPPLPTTPSPRDPLRTPEDSDRDIERDPRRRLRSERDPTESDPSLPEPPPDAPIPSAPSGPLPDEYGGPPSADVPGVPGLGGAPVWQLPGVLPDRAAARAAPTAPPPQRATSTDKAGEVLREAMRSKDKSLGLDLPAAGTVATVVADAVRSSDTPDTARATFEVRLSGSGQVLGVRVASSTAGAAELWARVARAVAARLTGRSLTMTTAFAKGATVYVSVVSAVKMPSGASSGGVHASGSGFGFDLSDIGARPVRVVSSSFRVTAVD